MQGTVCWICLAFFLFSDYSKNIISPSSENKDILLVRKTDESFLIGWRTDISRSEDSLYDSFLMEENSHYKNNFTIFWKDKKNILWMKNIFRITSCETQISFINGIILSRSWTSNKTIWRIGSIWNQGFTYDQFEFPCEDGTEFWSGCGSMITRLP